MKFGVYVSGNGTRLVKYIQAYRSCMLDFACIVHDGDENAELIKLAGECGVPYHHIDLPKMTGIAAGRQLSDFLLDTLKKSDASYCFCFGVRILSGPLLEHYENRIINFHPSLLPAFAGLNAIDQALEAKAFMLGNTVHFIAPEVDKGPVIMQSFLPAARYSGYEDVLDLQLPMLHQIGLWLASGRIRIDGLKVTVESAEYSMGTFVPAVEFELL